MRRTTDLPVAIFLKLNLDRFFDLGLAMSAGCVGKSLEKSKKAPLVLVAAVSPAE